MGGAAVEEDVAAPITGFDDAVEVELDGMACVLGDVFVAGFVDGDAVVGLSAANASARVVNARENALRAATKICQRVSIAKLVT